MFSRSIVRSLPFKKSLTAIICVLAIVSLLFVDVLSGIDAKSKTSAPVDEYNHLPVAGSRYVFITGGVCSEPSCIPSVVARAKPMVTGAVTYSKLQNGSKHRILNRETDADGNEWYQLWHGVDKTIGIYHPERIKGSWWILASETTQAPLLAQSAFDPSKTIRVSIGTQMLRAYEGDKLVYETKISSGLWKYPTPLGTFHILVKRQTRYMQDAPGFDSFDLPGVADQMKFTGDGASIHGAYWHNAFGTRRSHGCINVPNDAAEWLYAWAAVGTPVVITI